MRFARYLSSTRRSGSKPMPGAVGMVNTMPGADVRRGRLSSSRSGFQVPVQLQQGLARQQRRRAGGEHGQHLQGGGDGDTRAPDVEDAAHVRGVGQVGDLQRLGDAAGRAAVRLHDVGGFVAQQLGEAPAPELRFAGGFGNR